MIGAGGGGGSEFPPEPPLQPATPSSNDAISEISLMFIILSSLFPHRLQIRDHAEARLGDKFDVKDFHTHILMDGPMPLSMLDDKMERWVDAQL